MSMIRFSALSSTTAAGYREGEVDAYGLRPERCVSDGDGVPCRHCLRLVGAGEPYLILAHRPFPDLQPYAETGPIFLHAEACERYDGNDALPPILRYPSYILRGYGDDDRIVYGSGAVVPREEIRQYATELLGRDDIAYVHVRSATNNCYQCRIDRA